MLNAARVATSLHEQREAFRESAEQQAMAVRTYRELASQLSTLSSAEIIDRMGGVEWPGARPLPEFDSHGLIARFPHRWNTAQEARTWALERLRGVPTLAVDGSQIAPSKEFGVPVSLVQVAWFENYHDADRPYVKDVRSEVVLGSTDAQAGEEFFATDSRLSQHRFRLEMSVAVERMQALPVQARPVVFIDGTFVLSFAGRMAPPARASYLTSLFALLASSQQSGVPVAGYVDLSYASDLATMLDTVFDQRSGGAFDAQILAGTMEPFDRTAVFQCARPDVLPLYMGDDGDFSHELLFVYLQIGVDRLPARIDFPRWVSTAGLVDHLIDVIRAEIVVGSGYPYALETADATAVLTTEDRLTFYRLFHEFAREAGLTSALPGKSVSKMHRR